jgi:hypothetical protein
MIIMSEYSFSWKYRESGILAAPSAKASRRLSLMVWVCRTMEVGLVLQKLLEVEQFWLFLAVLVKRESVRAFLRLREGLDVGLLSRCFLMKVVEEELEDRNNGFARYSVTCM